MDKKAIFLNAWVRYNILAWCVGLGLLHPIIAHGLTGDHDVELSPPQLIMHTLSLEVVALLLAVTRNKTFQTLGPVNLFGGLMPFLVFFPAFFWLGYYTFYIPFDILFSFLSVGFINGLYLKGYMQHPKKWLWQSVFSMFCGAIVGIAAGICCYFWFIKNMKGISGDFAIWLLIATPSSILSSLVSRHFLKSQIHSPAL